MLTRVLLFLLALVLLDVFAGFVHAVEQVKRVLGSNCTLQHQRLNVVVDFGSELHLLSLSLGLLGSLHRLHLSTVVSGALACLVTQLLSLCHIKNNYKYITRGFGVLGFWGDRKSVV